MARSHQAAGFLRDLRVLGGETLFAATASEFPWHAPIKPPGSSVTSVHSVVKRSSPPLNET